MSHVRHMFGKCSCNCGNGKHGCSGARAGVKGAKHCRRK